MLSTFGEYLKRERELRDISLREISDETKVSFRYLEALEEDNRAKLPAEVFIKGFVRSYAKYIGLDPDEAILRYQEYQKTLEVTGESSRPTNLPAMSPTDSDKSNYFAWTIVALILLGLLLYYTYQSPQGEEELTVTEEMEHVEVEPVVPSIPETENVQEELPPDMPSEELPQEPPVFEKQLEKNQKILLPPLDITLSALERTWLAVDVDSSRHYDVTLQAGEEINFSMNDSMRLTIGNAGGLLIKADGRIFGPLGKSGKVINNFPLTRKDLQGTSLE